MHAGGVSDGDTHVRLTRGRHQAQKRRALGINTKDRLRGGGHDRGGERGALGNLAIHERGLHPGGDPSPICTHVYGKGVFVGEPSREKNRHRGGSGDSDLAR